MNKKINLNQWTSARVTIGNAGNSIPTNEILKFNSACANARDAVHSAWDFEKLKNELNEESILVSTQVHDRAEFLKRPDLGKKLSKESHEQLENLKQEYDVVFIVSDGLSATAIDKNFLMLWKSLKEKLIELNFKVAPLIIAPYARVAISDEIGFCLNAKLVVILIGERPGLTAYDSLGIYLTYDPKPSNTDANRNCISNIRGKNGLSFEVAIQKLIYLIKESIRLKISGTSLKEENSIKLMSS